jgi:hypothetical protein
MAWFEVTRKTADTEGSQDYQGCFVPLQYIAQHNT